MSKKNIKVTCYLAIIVFLFLQLLNFETLKAVGYAVSIATVLDIAYDRYFWRFNPLEKTPKLFGTYDETSLSSYNGGYEYKAKAVIKQTLSSITVFEEVEGSGYSESITANLVKSSSDGLWKLYYTYRTYPAMSKHDDMHEGTVILRVDSENTLNGVYFTNRLDPTQGNMHLRKISDQISFLHQPNRQMKEK